MKDMKPDEDCIYPSSRIAQNGVGLLEIATMAFPSAGGSIRFCHEITICGNPRTDTTWGDVIFRGSLQDLIDLANKVKEA